MTTRNYSKDKPDDNAGSGGGASGKGNVTPFPNPALAKDSKGLATALGAFGCEYRYNIRSRRHEIRDHRITIDVDPKWAELDDATAAYLRERIKEKYNSKESKNESSPLYFSHRAWDDAINVLSLFNEVDPFKKWLDDLPMYEPPDDEDEPTPLEILAGAINPKIDKNDHAQLKMVNQAIANLLMAAIARTYKPAAKVDEMPVLVGKQGIMKSSFFRYLFPEEYRDEWYRQGLDFAARRKEQIESIGQAVFVEASELENLSHVNLGALKSFMTTQTDSYRGAYEHYTTTRPRRFVMFGTSNDEHGGVLPNDASGNRRFICIPVDGYKDDGSKKAARETIEENREQIWAEALHRYLGDENYWLQDDDAATRDEINEGFRRADQTTEQIVADILGSDDFAGRRDLTISDLRTASNGAFDRVTDMAISRALKHAGWRKDRKARRNGKMSNIWVPDK